MLGQTGLQLITLAQIHPANRRITPNLVIQLREFLLVMLESAHAASLTVCNAPMLAPSH